MVKYIILIVLISIHFSNCYSIDFKVFKKFTEINNEYTVNQVKNLISTDSFCKEPKCLMVIKDTASINWVYFEIDHNEKSEIVIIGGFMYHHITAYFFDSKMHLIDSSKAGFDLSRENKVLNTMANTLKVPIGHVRCLIRYKTHIPTGIDWKAHHLYDYANMLIIKHSFSALISGIFLLAIIYSLILAIQARKIIYIYYIGYVLSFWIFMLSINQETSFYLSWLKIDFSYGYYIIPNFIITLSLIWYSQELLQLRQKLPKFYYFNILLSLLIILHLITYLIFDWIWNDSLLNSLFLLPSLIASIILIRRKYTNAWFIFIGILIIYSAQSSHNGGLLHHKDNYIFSFLGVLEIIFFGFSIGFWVNYLIKENEKSLLQSLSMAQENEKLKVEQNEILENEVLKKTKELHAANLLLSDYSKEIEKINGLLQKENTVLKVDVSDQLKARSQNKIMDFVEFQKSFPNEKNCIQHISDIKWANGYACIKCGYKEYSFRKNSPEDMARRCMKCGNVETVPSGTLFHGVKFPLQKAFYLTYLISAGKRFTLEELSQEISLRLGTVFLFTQKIKTAMQEKTKGKTHKDGWSHLILIKPQIKAIS